MTELKTFRNIALQRILSDKQEPVLTEPLDVSIDFQNEAWLMRNDELGMVAASKDYDDCLKEFNDEFAFVWKQYGTAPDDTLTPDAKEENPPLCQKEVAAVCLVFMTVLKTKEVVNGLLRTLPIP